MKLARPGAGPGLLVSLTHTFWREWPVRALHFFFGPVLRSRPIWRKILTRRRKAAMPGEVWRARPSWAIFAGNDAFTELLDILPALLLIGLLIIPVFVAHHTSPEVTHFGIFPHFAIIVVALLAGRPLRAVFRTRFSWLHAGFPVSLQTRRLLARLSARFPVRLRRALRRAMARTWLPIWMLTLSPGGFLIMRLTILGVRKNSGGKTRRSVWLATLAWCRLAKAPGGLPLRRSSLTWTLLVLPLIWALLWRLSLPRAMRRH